MHFKITLYSTVGSLEFYNFIADCLISNLLLNHAIFLGQTLFTSPQKVDIYSFSFNKSTILPSFSHRYGDEYTDERKGKERGSGGIFLA